MNDKLKEFISYLYGLTQQRAPFFFGFVLGFGLAAILV